MAKTSNRTFIGKGDGDITFNIRYSSAFNTTGLSDVLATVFGPQGNAIAINLSLVENIPGLYQAVFIPQSGIGEYLIVITVASIKDRIEAIFKIDPPEKVFTRINLAVIPEKKLIKDIVNEIVGKTIISNNKASNITKIDMRSEMNSLLEKDGVFFIHRKIDHSQRCSCVDANLEADQNCSRCAGMGFFYEDKLIKTYWFQRGSFLGADITSPINKTNKHGIVLYFSFNEEVRESDIIIQPVSGLNGNIEVPHRIKRMYDVVTVFPRIEHGSVQFLEAYGQERNLGK